ncbi:MAG TPA: sulfatase, partial [Algoriphagus sp.]|nr:sulfatase [Algoriphagus sp.]
ITYPDQFQEKAVQKPVGESILPILKNEKSEAHDSTYVFALEHRGYAMLRKGKWKLLNLKIPFERENFGLYDLENDLIEQNDLKNTFPEKYQELLKDWDTWSKKVGVQTPTPQPKK